MKLRTRLLTLLLTAAVITSVFTGCQSRQGGEDSSKGEASSRPSASQNSKEGAALSTITPNFLEQVEEKFGENEDTIGWLQVPGTNVDDVVVQKSDDKTNKYYLRLDFNKAKHFNGVYYADFRAALGDGTRQQVGSNICIYGHSIVDDPEDQRYDTKFGNLHNFREEELAREMPYIFFSTAKENLAYEVVAVFVANADDVAYNHGDKSQAEFAKLVRDEVLPRSIYNYDTEIKDDDKFLTLSTCIYKLPTKEQPTGLPGVGAETGYPNTWYRYAIMAKLVDANTPLKSEATFTVNKNLQVDKDTYPKK